MRKFLFLLFTVMLVSGNVNAQYYDDEQYNGGYVEDTYDVIVVLFCCSINVII